jgi:hypothetical protein
MDLIGKEVLAVSRQDCDLPKEYRNSYKGVIVSIEHGLYPLITFDCGLQFLRTMPAMDLSLASDYPRGKRLTEYLTKIMEA